MLITPASLFGRAHDCIHSPEKLQFVCFCNFLILGSKVGFAGGTVPQTTRIPMPSVIEFVLCISSPQSVATVHLIASLTDCWTSQSSSQASSLKDNYWIVHLCLFRIPEAVLCWNLCHTLNHFFSLVFLIKTILSTNWLLCTFFQKWVIVTLLHHWVYCQQLFAWCRLSFRFYMHWDPVDENFTALWIIPASWGNNVRSQCCPSFWLCLYHGLST